MHQKTYEYIWKLANTDNMRNPLDSIVVERQPRDEEVAGSSLTHCAVEYGPGQAAHAHLLLSPSSITWCSSGEAVMICGWEGNRKSGVAVAMRHCRLWWFIAPVGSDA